MGVVYSKLSDFDAWISLAKEVEPLFGPMADELNFRESLKQAISSKTAFCIHAEPHALTGGVIISQELNEIAWLAVSQQHQKQGYGRKLLEFAIGKLNRGENISVQTFDKSVPEGEPARKLYSEFGFLDIKDRGLNPAGVPTVIMQLEASKPI